MKVKVSKPGCVCVEGKQWVVEYNPRSFMISFEHCATWWDAMYFANRLVGR